MQVKEIIELSALLLDIELTDDVRKDLVRCYNLVEQELATDYFPILEVEKFFHVKDKIYYKDFSRKPHMLGGIQDFHGESVCFRLTPEYINLIKNYDGGTFFVKYYYIPEEKDLYSNSTYGAEYINIIKYGIATEYCLMQGNFDLAAIYSQKYKERIKLKGPKKKK
jgi:hypothetical protein